MKKHRLFFGLILGAAVGLGGETLLLLEHQCRRVERTLGDDFRVVFFLKAEQNEGDSQVLLKRLRALGQVEDARAVSKKDALAQLKRQEPELAEAVTPLNENPLDAGFEVRLTEAGLGRLPQWLAEAEELADWSDVRYKPAQAEAVLEAAFYARFIAVVLSGLVCLAALLAFFGLWAWGEIPHGHWPALGRALRANPGSILGGALGGVLGACAVCAIALPLRTAAAGLAWPSAVEQFVLIAAAAVAGWVLCGLRD